MTIEGISSNNNAERITDGTAQTQSVSTAFSEVLESTVTSGSTDLDALFDKAAEKFGVSANLLKAVAKAESGFNPAARSSAGAMGIMQLMPATAAAFKVTDPYDPEQSIMGGAELLSGLLKKYDGDTSLALAAYNAGSGSVDKYGGIPPYKETQNYVVKVMGYLGEEITAGYVSSSRNTGTGITALSSEKDVSAMLMENLIMTMIMNQPSNSSDEEDKRSIPL